MVDMDKPIYAKQLKTFILRALKVVPHNDQNNFVLMNMLRCYSDTVTAKHCDVLQLCRFCGNNYYEVPKYINLLPAPKLNRFLRRLRKVNPDCGTPYQLSSIKKLRNSNKSQSIIQTCRFCQKESQKQILKPDKFAAEVQAEKASKKIINKRIESETKKLKKKKKYAGLNENAVISAKKLKLMLSNPEDVTANTPNRKQINSSIINLNTPQNTRTNDISTIVLDTPQSTRRNDISTIVLDTPQTTRKNDMSTIILDTPITTKSNKNKKLGTPQLKKNKPILNVPKISKNNTNVTLTKGLSKKARKRLKLKEAKKNIILASDSKKAEDKPDALSNLLKTDNVNKTVSVLEQFLKSLS